MAVDGREAFGTRPGEDGLTPDDRWSRMFQRQAARRHLIERWAAELRLPVGGAAADIGCGPGLTALAVGRLLGPQGRMYAVDTEPGALAFLAARWQEQLREGTPLARLHSVLADAAHVELPEPVDGLFLTHVLHHVPDPAAVLRRAASLLRPSGAALVAEFDPDGAGAIGPPLERRIPRWQLRAWLGATGWRVEREVSDQEEQYAWVIVPRSAP